MSSSGRRRRGRRESWVWPSSGFPPPGPPIPVEDGLKARSRRGAIGETWWSKRFIDVLEQFHEGPRLARGRAYARKGQVISLDLEPGRVAAKVQGTRPRPYDVEIRVGRFGDDEWARAEATIAQRAVFLARLLAGEMPDEIEEAFAQSQLSLFPSRNDLAADCSCPDWGDPCKHVAAVYYLLAERFDEDPFLILAWRGRPRERLLAELRVLRGDTDEHGAERAPTTESGTSPDVPGWVALLGETEAPDVDIELDLDRFWGAADALPLLEHAPVPTSMPSAILRELPASGLSGDDHRPIEASLEPVYVAIVRAATELLRSQGDS